MSDLMAEIGEVAGEVFFEGAFEIEDSPEAPAAGDTPELTIDGSGRAHGPDGKFVSLEERVPEAPEAPEEPEAEEQPAPEAVQEESPEEAPAEVEEEELVELDIEDPDVLSFLEKYDGDVLKALKAATEGQKLIGRQGQELGEFRSSFQEMLGDAMSQMQREIMASTIDWEQQIERNPQRAAELAVRTGNGDALVAALNAWREEDGPQGPDLFLRAAQAELELQSRHVGEPEQPERSLADEMDAFKQKHPDAANHLQTMQKIVSERPTLAKALMEGSPQERVTALEDALLLARSQSMASDTSAAARKIILRAKADADKAKADAVVESATNTSVQQRGPSEEEVLQQTLRTLTGLDDLEVI